LSYGLGAAGGVRAPILVYANAPWRKRRVLAVEEGSVVHKELKEQLHTYGQSGY
jgi:CRISPR/Cas system CSM-associated protein Csm4 (group 5 of RAMP superfamily)